MKKVPIETEVILLIMSTDFDDLNIDILINLQYDIYDTINALVNCDDELDMIFAPEIGKIVQSHLLEHLSWLRSASDLQPQCSEFCAAINCLDDDDINCPRDEWRLKVIESFGDMQLIPVLAPEDVIAKCMKVLIGIYHMNKLGAWN